VQPNISLAWTAEQLPLQAQRGSAPPCRAGVVMLPPAFGDTDEPRRTHCVAGDTPRKPPNIDRRLVRSADAWRSSLCYRSGGSQMSQTALATRPRSERWKFPNVPQAQSSLSSQRA
jgi:hypothetical protein